jgi:hypothetical protein
VEAGGWRESGYLLRDGGLGVFVPELAGIETNGLPLCSA